MHNPLPIPKEELGVCGGVCVWERKGSQFSQPAQSWFSWRPTLHPGIQNLCSSEPGILKPAGTEVYPSLMVLTQIHSPEPSGWVKGDQSPEPENGFCTFTGNCLCRVTECSVCSLWFDSAEPGLPSGCSMLAQREELGMWTLCMVHMPSSWAREMGTGLAGDASLHSLMQGPRGFTTHLCPHHLQKHCSARPGETQLISS